MNKYMAGFLSGFIATFILSLLMLVKMHYGFMQHAGGGVFVFTHWVVQVLLGTFIWGGLFVMLSPALRGRYWVKGIYFGIIAWLLMALGTLPLVHYGVFSLRLTVDMMMAALMWYVIYGFLLGFVYHMLPKKRQA